MTTKECKHDIGWLAIKDPEMFIFENEKVSFNFQSRDRKTYKIKMGCNNIYCNKTRNVYITAKVEKWGKIK